MSLNTTLEHDFQRLHNVEMYDCVILKLNLSPVIGRLGYFNIVVGCLVHVRVRPREAHFICRHLWHLSRGYVYFGEQI